MKITIGGIGQADFNAFLIRTGTLFELGCMGFPHQTDFSSAGQYLAEEWFLSGKPQLCIHCRKPVHLVQANPTDSYNGQLVHDDTGRPSCQPVLAGS